MICWMADGQTEGAFGPGLGGRGITETGVEVDGGTEGEMGVYMAEIWRVLMYFMAGGTSGSSL